MLFGSFGGFFGDDFMGKAAEMALDLCLFEEMEKEMQHQTDQDWLAEDE